MLCNVTQRTIDHQLSFLRTELGYSLIHAEVNEEYSGANLLVYRSEKAAKQLEISADDGYFHCEIRHIIEGKPAGYEDCMNCIGFESLAVLESNGNCAHMDYFAGGSNGMKGVLATTNALFRRHASWLANDGWVDLERLRALRPYLADHGPSFFDKLADAVKSVLIPFGCEVAWHNKLMPPYHRDRYPDCILFAIAGKEGDMHISAHIIAVDQKDWRDANNIYTVLLNGDTLLEIDTHDPVTDEIHFNATSAALRTALEGVGLKV